MQLNEFINYHVETIGPEDTLQQAAEKMRDFDVGSIPVCDDNRLLGMVTDRDITIRAVANGDDPTITTVSDVRRRLLLRAADGRRSRGTDATASNTPAVCAE